MRALIVDDSQAARALARAALEDAGDSLGLPLEVDEASGGVEALRLLATVGFDVVVVDLHMPDVHGLEVLNFWRKRHGEGGVAILMTTDVSPRDREKATDLGVGAFVSKPVTAPALAAALAPLLPGARP